MQSLYDLSVPQLDGETTELGRFRGQVTLVVNLASECGYTPQYAGLQALHGRLEERGFAVLGFPCNDFGAQEPGTSEDIQSFCSQRYGVEFPMFAKVVTKMGREQSDVYACLNAAAGELPSWNFGKYLVNREGVALRFFPSDVAPDAPELLTAIEAELARPQAN